MAFDASTAVFTRPDGFTPMVGVGAKDPLPEYVVAAYQYATSSVPLEAQPAQIIVPGANLGDDERAGQLHDIMLQDVLRTVEHASRRNISVAVRSGGHSFAGHSSTTGDNIQLDMKNFKHIAWDDDEQTITCGTGVFIKDLDEKLFAREAFVPHGQCGTVCIGGHMTTCGYSVVVPRSFGLLIDHVVAVTLVLAPEVADGAASVVKLIKPDGGQTDERNDELWYALMGGGPGSFGVVIDVTIKPLWSREYPHSRSMITYLTYTPEKYQQCIDYIAGLAANDDLPADFNASCGIIGGNSIDRSKWSPLRAAAKLVGIPGNKNAGIDTAMADGHEDIYGEKIPPMCSTILFSTCWANLKGEAEPYEDCQAAKDFFAEQKKIIDSISSTGDFFFHAALAAAHFAGIKASKEFKIVDSKKHTLLNDAVKMTTYTPRSQPNPYVSASHVISNDCRKVAVPLDAGGPPLDGPTFITKHQDAVVKTPNVYPDNEFVLCKDLDTPFTRNPHLKLAPRWHMAPLTTRSSTATHPPSMSPTTILVAGATVGSLARASLRSSSPRHRRR